MDFFNHITYVTNNGPSNVYYASMHACFPPLVYIMYYFFGILLPENSTVMYDAGSTSAYALLLYIWYCTLVSVILSYLINKLYKGRFSFGLAAIILTSNIYVFGIIERGNSAVLACLFLIGAVLIRDSEKGYYRETALIFIAIAAGIKIYPAVFGILYVFEKRWAETIRLILYGIICFFAPFIFFGGIPGLLQFIQNQLIIQNMGASGLACLKALINYIADIIGLNIPNSISTICVVLYFLLAIADAYILNTLWKKTFLLSSIMILCPFWSGPYTPVYLILPLILFMTDLDTMKSQIPASPTKKIFYIYAVLFGMIFSFCAVNINHITDVIKISVPSMVVYIPIYIMNIILLYDGLKSIVKKLILREY